MVKVVEKIDSYKILDLNPTDNFINVKAAYIEKEKAYLNYLSEHREQKAGVNLALSALREAYALIDSKKKLEQYYKNYRLGNHTLTPLDSTAISLTVNITNKTNDMIEVYIPVDVVEKGSPSFQQTNGILMLNKPEKSISPQQFAADFNFNEVANVLNFKSRQSRILVGCNAKEALDIMNLHSHCWYTVLVKVAVPLTYLSDRRLSGKEVDRASTTNEVFKCFFWLEYNHKFNSEDIISIRPVLDPLDTGVRPKYRNSRRHPFGRNPLPWVENVIVTQVKKEVKQEIEQSHHALQAKFAELKAEYNQELGRCGVVRFFTDTRSTKRIKLNAVEELNTILQSKEFDKLVEKAKAMQGDKSITHTSWPLKSRMAELLKEAIKIGEVMMARREQAHKEIANSIANPRF